MCKLAKEISKELMLEDARDRDYERKIVCLKDEETYKVVFDNGKPYEETFKGEEALKEALTEFYDLNKDGEYPFDSKVYNSKDEDITESQFINEMVADIIGETIIINNTQEVKK